MPFDISAIPPPDSIREVNYENYVSDMIAHLKILNNQFTSVKESDPVYSVLQVCAYQISLKAQEINERVRAVMLLTSTGADLDNLGVIYNEPRRIIVPGDTTANPPVEEIRESDGNYKNRLLDSFKALALGSREWYKKLVIESGSPFELTVKDLQVLGPEDSVASLTIPPGEVWCYIESISETNPIPSSTIITQVQNYLDNNQLPDESLPRLKSLERRFLGDTIRVYSCIQKPYTISVTIKEVSGLIHSVVRKDVETVANEFVQSYRRIGEKIPLSAIYAALNTIDVFELDLVYPLINIEPELNELPIATVEFELESNDYVTGITWSNFSDETNAKWSIIENSSIWYIVFTNDINDDDLIKLEGVGEGRKFDIITGSEDTDTDVISGQVVSVLLVSVENSNSEDHYYLELSEEPDLTGITAGELYVSFRSGVEII